MQHRGIEFKIVKTRSSAGWMWMVEVSSTEKEVGTHRDREGAIRRAKKFIDELVSKPESETKDDSREMKEAAQTEAAYVSSCRASVAPPIGL